MNKLSSSQTYTLFLVSLLGTSIIFGTPKMVPDVWLVDMITILPGIAILFLYAFIGARLSPKGLYPLLIQAWGRHAGLMLVLAYAVYLLYIAARNVRDMLELIQSTLLRNTSASVLAVVFSLLMAYAAAGGIRVIGGMSQLIAAYILLFFTAITVFLWMSGILNPERMLPFLSEGILPIIRTSLTTSLWVPYGETIVFLVLFDSMRSSGSFRKNGLAAVCTAGVILTMSDLLQTWTMGMDLQRLSAFPLLDAARLINVANFITRMDALVAMIIILSVLVKSSLFLYAGLKGVSLVFGGRSSAYAYSFALFVAAISIMVSKNYAEHITEGLKIVVWSLHIPFQLGIPLVSAVVVWLRHKGGKNP